MDEDISVKHFREYLRIPTVHPDPNYEPAVEFLCRLAEDAGLQHRIVRLLPTKPVVIMTWLGRVPSLKSVVLNSHMDVVPVFSEFWKYDPFAAHKDENGDIYGRGAQDMKSVGMQYLEAIRHLKENGVQPLRTIHLTYVPDEEISSATGMQLFIHTPEFKELDIGLSLDEGTASTDDVYRIYYGERVKWHLKVTCLGYPGHGSKFIENTAAEKLQMVMNKILTFREEQKQLLQSDANKSIGDVVTVNLTILRGGVQVNVVPAEMVAEFDIRVPPSVDYEKLTGQFESWVEEAGATCEWLEKILNKKTTVVDESSPWWRAFSGTMSNLGLKYNKEIFIAATDAHFLRELGYPAFGFSPIIDTPNLLHAHNERLNTKVYLKGIEIYTHLIIALANVPAF